jgi:hypothetical protein
MFVQIDERSRKLRQMEEMRVSKNQLHATLTIIPQTPRMTGYALPNTTYMYIIRSTSVSDVGTNFLRLFSQPKLLSPILPEFFKPTHLTPQEPANRRAYRQRTCDYHKSPDAGAVADFRHVHTEHRRSRVNRDEDECKDSHCSVLVVSSRRWTWFRKMELTCDCVFAFADCKPRLLMLVLLLLRIDGSPNLFRQWFGFPQQSFEEMRRFVGVRTSCSWEASVESRDLTDAGLQRDTCHPDRV